MSLPERRSPEPRPSDYERFVNPQWARLLSVLQMNVEYVRCAGAELFTADGRRLLDFNSGYCVHNAGHNHPRIVAALKQELDRHGPAMLQSHVPERAGELARRLCEAAGGRFAKVFFTSSGSEGIETAIKFSRAHTRRPALLCAEGGFHGLTCGALSLTSNPFWTAGFGPLLPEVETVPFGHIEPLERKLASRKFAAFIVEPVQAENGVRLPAADYLREAQALCRRTGTLLVLDEVQTGFHRTGGFLAAQRFQVEPDVVVLAKAMSGGLVPSGAVLMSDEVFASVYDSLKRAFVHTSTYSENGLALRAGLATLDVLEDERLGERAAAAGESLRADLRARLDRYEMVADVRGLGLLCAIEFRKPQPLRMRILFEAFARIHPGMFGQVVVMRMFRDGGVLCQICGNDFMVLKVAPPLVVTERQIAEFGSAVEAVVERMHASARFWTDALALARRVLHTI